MNNSYKLIHIDLEINHRCNLACRHCSAVAVKKKSAPELSENEIKKILAEGKELGLKKVGLTGGEPLFDIDKLEKISRFCVERLEVPLHTHLNGTLVEREMCNNAGVLTLFESVSVTFLGGDASTHDYMTKTDGSFEKAFRGATIIAESGLPLTCYFIPTHGITKEFKNLAVELEKAGVKRIRAMALSPSGRARPIFGETVPTEDEIVEFENDLLNAGKENNLSIEAGYCTRLSMPGLSVLSGHDTCTSGLNRVHINSNGDVFPCTAASGVKELTLGNIVNNGKSLKDIWFDSEKIKMVRQVQRKKLPECYSCTNKDKCFEGCIVNTCGTMPKEEYINCPLMQ